MSGISIVRPAQTLIVRELKSVSNRGCLIGFVRIEMPSGLILNDCRLFEKGGERWVGLPSRQYQRKDGKTAYSPVVEFASKQANDRFQAEAIDAIARFERAGGNT